MEKKEYWSYQEVCHELDEELAYQKKVGMYVPLLRRLDIYIDDEIPPKVHKDMEAHGNAPMCMTDCRALSIDRQFLYDMLNASRFAHIKDNREHPSFIHSFPSLRQEVRNVLVHEFTHALCQHTWQANRVMNGILKKNGKVQNKEYLAMMMACEVEANRGYGIDRYASIYHCAVTDSDPYPKAREAKYLMDIYEVILKEYSDDLEQDFDFAQKMIKQAMEDAQERKQQNASEGGKQGQEQPTDKGGDEGENQDGSEGQTDSGDASKGQSGGSESKNDPLEGLTDEQRKRVQLMVDALTDPSNQITPRQYDPDFDAGNITEEDLEAGGSAYGVGGGGIDASGKTPEKVLAEWENIYNADVIAKSLEKLKGNMVGTIAKERVSTYSRQARRDSSDGLLKKGTKRSSRSVPKILVALDKSGSMSSTTTAQATEALAKIFDITGRPTEGCWICLHDGCVKDVKPFKKWKDTIAHFYPSGGNDFSDVIREANKLGVDVVLNVGDAGDSIHRKPAECKKFRNAGRRWIDVNIAKGSREYNSEWVERVFMEDFAQTGIVREWEDLTGGFTLTADEVVQSAKKAYPEAVKKWGK